MWLFSYCCCCPVAKCPMLCDPMDCSTPGLPVPHSLLEFTQDHISWISDAIQPFHPLPPLSPVAFSCFPVSLPLRKPGFVVTVRGLLFHPQPEGGTLPGLSFNTGLTLQWISLLGLERDATVDLLWAPMKTDPATVTTWGLLSTGGKDSPRLSVLHANISEGIPLVSLTL